MAVAKSPDAFRTISEAAEEVGAPQHVLRFWETKFAFVSPVKRAGGRRFYRPQDIAILKGVKRLLHEEGLTIRGVERLHKDQGLKRILGVEAESLSAVTAPADATSALAAPGLRVLLADLEQAKARLDAVLAR